MEDKNYFAKNLKYLRNKFDDTQLELAEFLGKKSLSSVSDWERGKSIPDAGTLNKIANKYHVTIDDLLERDVSENKKVFSLQDTKLVPIVGKVAAGTPNYAVEDVIGYMSVPPNKIVTNSMIYLQVSSDSMDKQFPTGSYVLVDGGVQIENGDVAVVKVNGHDATLKQVKFDYDKKLMYLIPNSNNEEYYPTVVDINEDEVTLVGKVVGVFQSM